MVLTNHASRTIKAGEQIMFFYGCRSSSHLLMNYGFCARDNRYDFYELVLNTDPESMTPEDIVCWE